MTPTNELYNSIQMAYDHFNESLFENQLPQVLVTTQRQQGIMGYFAPNRWASVSGNKCHEIAINPLYVGRAMVIEVMQTLVHEMAHCWQECFGKPSRRAYHNKEWSKKMVDIGLMPSTTGRPGGALTGQHMSDYPAPGGKFILSCEKLLKDKKFKLPWVDRFARTSGTNENVHQLEISMEALSGLGEEIISQLTTRFEDHFGEESFAPIDSIPVSPVKSKYTCSSCKINVWGKPKLKIQCEECNISLIESRS